MAKRVIILNFDEQSISYEAFSKIKQLVAAGNLTCHQMAIVTHTNEEQHQFKIDDFADFKTSSHSANDSFIGMIIGVLGGPLGMLLGWFAGSMIGGAQDLHQATHMQSVFDDVIGNIEEGQTGVILVAEEEDNRPLNQLIFTELGGQITRLDYTQVEQDVRNAQNVEQAVQSQARKSWSLRDQAAKKDSTKKSDHEL